MIPATPVGLPGLAVLMIGLGVFVAALLGARRRAARTREQGPGRRDRASWVGILGQMAGMAIVGLGPIVVRLDPLGLRAWLAAAVIAGLMGGAFGLFVSATRAMGRNWAIVAQTRSDHQLVTSGPFAHVRNPIYVGLFLLMLALAVGFGHYASLLVGAPLYLAGTMARVHSEERLLQAHFGAAYADYVAQVKRFIPGIV